MNLDLDAVVARHDTDSVKWDFRFVDGALAPSDAAHPKHGDDQLLPLWVADMDFPCPPAVTQAVAERAAHGIFGYTKPRASYFEAVKTWSSERYGWPIETDWIVPCPGVIPAMNIAVMTFANAGEQILIQGPVYYHFMRAPENNGRIPISNDLVYSADTGTYSIDFEDFERKAADPATTMAMICNPHNPSSRVWTEDELRRMGEICVKHDLIIVSDEIHCDLIFKGHTFTPMGSLSQEIADRTICMTAASKTFNLAGLKTSNTIIPNPQLRARFNECVGRLGLFGTNCFGLVATEAAYTHGAEWLDSVMDYVWDNYRFVEKYFAEHLPQVQVVKPEGTYLLWLDCSGLGIDAGARKQLLDKAGIFLNAGGMFGDSGAQFERINLACPRATVERAVKRMAAILQPD